ncbi:Homoserine_homoserine lactone efflux protein [Nocardiopsis dassonvillei]|uniref:LysE family translocator n=1 Tax=Nocardiopsis dassonvillei TaxID=2014 RepID=UPI003F54F945
MDLVTSLPAFLLAVVLISASPGPAMVLIMRRAALRGLPGAVPTVLGLEAGLYVWALCVGAGLAAVVAASETAYLVLRVVGAAFLLYLGVKALLSARRAGAPAGAEAVDAHSSRDPGRAWWRAFGEGALVMLANPKAAAFMLAFYPQFVPADRPLFTTTALLALLQVAVEIVLYLALAAVVGRAGAWFRRPAVRRWSDAVSGTVLVGLGVRMAVHGR